MTLTEVLREFLNVTNCHVNDNSKRDQLTPTTIPNAVDSPWISANERG